MNYCQWEQCVKKGKCKLKSQCKTAWLRGIFFRRPWPKSVALPYITAHQAPSDSDLSLCLPMEPHTQQSLVHEGPTFAPCKRPEAASPSEPLRKNWHEERDFNKFWWFAAFCFASAFICLSLQVFNHCCWALKGLWATLFPPLTFSILLTLKVPGDFWVINCCCSSQEWVNFPLKKWWSLSAYVHLHHLLYTHK